MRACLPSGLLVGVQGPQAAPRRHAAARREWQVSGLREPARVTRPAALARSDAPLAPALGKTVVITLPDGLSVYDFDRFGVWCDLAQVDFGSVAIPHDVRVPPSARQLALALVQPRTTVQTVSPVAPVQAKDTVSPSSTGLNCEVLHEPLGLELRWVLDNDQVVMQIVGRVRHGEYMSLGLSKDDAKSRMIDADAIVAWIDGAGRGHAVDYFLASKEQVSFTPSRGLNLMHNIRSALDPEEAVLMPRSTATPVLVWLCLMQQLSTVIICSHSGGHRPHVSVNAATPGALVLKDYLLSEDKDYDQHIYSDGPQAVMWAVGPINDRSDVSYHSMHSQGVYYVIGVPPSNDTLSQGMYFWTSGGSLPGTARLLMTSPVRVPPELRTRGRQSETGQSQP